MFDRLITSSKIKISYCSFIFNLRIIFNIIKNGNLKKWFLKMAWHSYIIPILTNGCKILGLSGIGSIEKIHTNFL